MRIYKVDEDKIKISDLFKMNNQGATFICSKCGSELVSAFTKEEAKNLGLAPGIHCPNDLSHVNIHFLLK